MTEEQRIAELRKPRYKVIEGWPGSENFPFHKGDIIIQNKPGKAWESIHGRNVYFGVNPDMHHHLFKRLEWWQERKPEDMPEYVRVNTEVTCLFLGSVMKVRMWKIREAGHFYCWLEEDKAKSFPDMFKYDPENFIPATPSEYQQYINSKQKP